MLYNHVIIAGIQLTFWTDHPSDIECINELFAYHIQEGKENKLIPEDTHDIIIASSREKTKPVPTASLRWSGVVNIDTPVKWYDNSMKDENIIEIGRDVVVKHFAGRKLTICYLYESGKADSKSKRPRLSCFIFFLLHSILSMNGKFCLHASCVSKNDKAYLFLGKSGEGKSTISYILARQGYEYMGDDLVFISKNSDEQIVIDALLCKIKLKDKKRDKESIDMIKNDHVAYSYRRQLGGILKLQRTEASEKSSLIPVSGTEVFAWLMGAGNNIIIQYYPELWMEICEKVTALPAFSLLFADKRYFDHNILNSI